MAHPSARQHGTISLRWLGQLQLCLTGLNVAMTNAPMAVAYIPILVADHHHRLLLQQLLTVGSDCRTASVVATIEAIQLCYTLQWLAGDGH